MTYEEIVKVSDEIRYIGIERTDKKTGETTVKSYAEVSERVIAFRKLYPEGTIFTKIVDKQNGEVTVMATIYAEPDRILATAHAQEKENASYINKTSYVENCETSAVGRALGLCGIGIASGIASADEMRAAKAQQEYMKEQEVRMAPIGEARAEALRKELAAKGVTEAQILEEYSVTDLKSLTEEQMRNIIVRLSKSKGKK